MALALLMGSPRWRSATVGVFLALLLGAAACGGSPNTARHSPTTISPSPAQASSLPTPHPLTGAYGVLVSPPGTGSYTVSLVGTDGRVVASAQATSPAAVTCANAATAIVPLPVSTSNTRVYFMDAQGVVHFLAPTGETGRATTVPTGSDSRRSMFAVSPDDQRIAVIVDDFNSSGAMTRLYVEDLNGGTNHLDLFSQTGAYTLWPTGWHGSNNLVVAKVAACKLNGGAICCLPLELHVVDPATASRRFTLGGGSCFIAGPPSAAGAACLISATGDTPAQIKVMSWTAALIKSFSQGAPSAALLSPDGHLVGLVSGNTSFDGLQKPDFQLPSMCGWIDDIHVLSGGDTQHQPGVGNVNSGVVVPVAAQGDCGGRIPGGL